MKICIDCGSQLTAYNSQLIDRGFRHKNVEECYGVMQVMSATVNPKFDSYENDFGNFQRPNFESIFTQMAVLIAQRSTCCRKKVAALFTDEKMTRVLCFGYNGTHRGGKNQCDSSEPGNCGCIHAEINALTKSVDSLEGSTCFVTLSPCTMCAKILINRGVKRVIYWESYRSNAGTQLLVENGVQVSKF